MAKMKICTVCSKEFKGSSEKCSDCEWNEMSLWQKIFSIGILLLLCYIGYSLLFPGGEDGTDKAQQQVSDKVQQQVSSPEPLSLSTKLTIAITGVAQDQVLGVNYINSGQSSPLVVKLKLGDNFSHKMMISGAFMDAQRIMEELEPTYAKDISSYQFWFVSDFIDQYGNVSEGKSLSFDFSRETVDKINWENMNHDRLKNLSENLWIHRLLKE